METSVSFSASRVNINSILRGCITPVTMYHPTISSTSDCTHPWLLTHVHTLQGLCLVETLSRKKNPKKKTDRTQTKKPKSARSSWTLWQIYLGQIVSEKLPLELPWTKLAVGESKSRCMRVGDNWGGGRMCWCAAGGWGGTMDGLVSPLADWFEMAPLSLSPWGVPLSCSWFPLLTNSKQKSISFSRRGWGGGEYRNVFQLGKVTQKTSLQEMADSLTLHLCLFSSLPSSSLSAVIIAQRRWWMVWNDLVFFQTQVGLGHLLEA